MADSTTFNDLKLLLGIKDVAQDDLLKLIIKHTESQVRLKIHKKASEPIPDELAFIVTEVAVRRYNRIGEEGKTNGSQDGLSSTWATSDFDDFASDIDTWLDDQKQHKSLGHAAFVSGYGGAS